MGFDTEHCYELTFNRLTPQAEGYQPGDDAEADMRNLLEIVERLRHRPGVEYVAVSQNSIPYIDGSNGFNLRIDSVLTTGMLRWGQPDYFRMFRVQGVAVLTEDGRKVSTTSPDSLAEAVHRSDRNVIISRNYVSAERYAKLGYADALPLLGYECDYAAKRRHLYLQDCGHLRTDALVALRDHRAVGRADSRV